MQSKNIDYLLILRGLASIGVIFGHALTYENYAFYKVLENSTSLIGKSLLSIYPMGGANFVLIFFVLSGYLMGKLFFNEKYTFDKENLLRFYKNRFFRIAPLLYFNLIICLIFFEQSNPSFLQIIGDFFFFNNITGRNINLVTWSISHEMQYYLLAPFIFLFFNNLKSSANMKLFKYGLLIFLFFISLHFTGLNYMYCFLAGFSINYFLLNKEKIDNKKLNPLLVLLITFTVSNLFFYFFYNSNNDFTARIILILFIMCLIYFLERINFKKNMENKFLQGLMFLGKISYGVYLWHYPILVVISNYLIKYISENSYGTFIQDSIIFHLMQIISTLTLTILISAVTFKYIEIKFRPTLYKGINK
ncbi:MAG: hypothetical protein C0626_05885 [Arcobacter sp.]|uniref:acyltransferase family protein n=1 Tax=uncultured Arcobacter sp. TaxID=165434 RepID=UPI000CC05937|nr:acyltransferase [uncultured Arcobacter sp.]PLY10504.1 MAG: hypothetical protein C0626_05885 [Arcobacter sp.]